MIDFLCKSPNCPFAALKRGLGGLIEESILWISRYDDKSGKEAVALSLIYSSWDE